MRELGLITGEGFESRMYEDHGRCWFVGDFDVDIDGSPNWRDDPFGQPNTTLRHEGKSIDSSKVPGIVVPLWFPKSVGPIVLGCMAKATNLRNMKSANCVVFDLGPAKKTGEGSPALAKLLNINPDPNIGGEDAPIVLYEIWPGTSAIVDGINYKLQPY